MREVEEKKFRSESQPFIADFNGDFLPDFLYSEGGEIKIAFQTRNPIEYITKPFELFL